MAKFKQWCTSTWISNRRPPETEQQRAWIRDEVQRGLNNADIRGRLECDLEAALFRAGAAGAVRVLVQAVTVDDVDHPADFVSGA